MHPGGESMTTPGITPTQYKKETPQQVRDILDNCMHRYGQRVRVFYGDTTTGRDWLEEYQTTGTIGRSTGNHPIPILISNSRSDGGPAILDHCIVRILINGREVYKHPNYYQPELILGSGTKDLPFGVYADAVKMECHANFKTESQARRYIEFMKGNRQAK
jgi:hypothetical protein